jgi:hypothetical protein
LWSLHRNEKARSHTSRAATHAPRSRNRGNLPQEGQRKGERFALSD